MNPPRHLLTILALGCCLPAACFFDPTVPDDAQLSCATDADCPEDFTCQTSIELCVLTASIDTSPPGLVGEVALEPSIGTIGQTFTLSFAASEPLFAPPMVSLNAGGRDAPFALDDAASDPAALAYVYTYTADGSEAQGPREIQIHLVDRFGTEAWPSGGLATLDFAAPRVTASAIGAAAAGAGTVVTLSLSLSEAAEGTPEVVMSAGGASLTWTHASASADGLEHSYTYTASGTEAEALYLVQASARDAAGNQGAPEEVARLALDFTAPILTEQLISPAALVRPGAILSVALEVSEPLPGPPVLVGLPLSASGTTISFAAEQPGESSLAYTHTVRAGEDGDYELSLDALVDAAGNLTPAQVIGAVRLDGAAPEIVNFAQSATSLNAAGSLEVTFEASEALSEPPVVEIEGRLFTRDDSSGIAPYRYTLDLGGTDLLGSYSISVTMVDEALNAATHRPGVVTVDTRPPQVIDARFTPAAARLGVTVLLTITVDEPLLEPGGAPALVLSWALPAGDPGFEFLVRSGLSYTYALMIDDSVPGPSYSVLSVDLIDEADNPASVGLSTVPSAPVTLTVDNQPPVLSGLATDRALYSAQPGFNSITLTLDVDEDLDLAPGSLEAVIGDVAFVCGAYQASSPRYTCTRPVDDVVDTHGGALIRITATDAAGNQSFDSTSVELDFQAPAVVTGSENVQLIPAASALLGEVSRVTLGTTVRVLFAADEPLSVDPEVFAMPAPRLDFAKAGGAGTFYIFEHTLSDAAAADGTREVSALLRDAVGNSATRVVSLPAPGFEVDRSAPQPLSAAQDDRLRYLRSPWGTSSSAGAPTFRVEQHQAGGLPAGATVIFWDRAATSTALELGRGLVDSGGTLATVALNRSDRALVFASLVDEAGNIDGDNASLLHNTEWVASYGGKVRGSSAENPHRAETRTWLSGLRQVNGADTGATEASPGPLQQPDTSSLRVASAQLRWRRLPTDEPPVSSEHYMVYDRVRDRMVLFVRDSGETWERVDGAWRQAVVLDLEGDGEPPAGGEYAFAYDERRAVMVLVDTAAAALSTWEWDGVSWRHVEVLDLEGDGAPGRRRWACMGWDGVNGEALLFGGETSFSHNQNLWTSSDELWSFDGVRWRQLDAAPSPPPAPAFRNCAMAWDPDRRRVVLLGRETWEWDGAVLEQITVGNYSFPPQAWLHRLAYDSRRARVVAHGGTDTDRSGLYDTWEYDGQTQSWSEAFSGEWTCTGHPCYRYNAGMAFDPVAQHTVLFGGDGKNDTWTWDGTTWTMLPRVDPDGDGDPVVNYFTSFGYDQDRERALLINWDQPSGYAPDWWQHDGVSWSVPIIEDDLGDGDPGWRQGGALIYDDHPGRQHFLLFGGYGECPAVHQCGDTWTFDGAEWEKRCDSAASGGPCDAGDGLPGERGWDPSAAFDSLRKETYLYGGRLAADGQELWRWDGAQWHLETPATATLPTSGLEGASMTYDETRDRIVMFGGWDGISPTTPHVWEWIIADSEWTEIVPTDPEGDGSPVQSYDTATYYDRARLAVVLHEDRYDLSPQQVHSWEWDGQSWRRLYNASPMDGELPSVSHEWISIQSVHDHSSGRTFLLGDNMWELERSAGVQPALTLHFDFAAASAPAGTLIQEITLDAVAGARGEVSVTPTDSVAIASWSDLGWQQHVTEAHGTGAPGPISWSSDVTTELDPLMVEGQLHFALMPEGVNGATSAEVVVDYVELRVRYRLP